MVSKLIQSRAGLAASPQVELPEKLHWRDHRPLRAANWAVPESAKRKFDLETWTIDEAAMYLNTFVDERCEKIEFLRGKTLVDLRSPIQDMAATVQEVHTAVAAAFTEKKKKKTAVGRKAPAVIRHPEDCRFIIPRYDFSDALRRVERKARSNKKSAALDRLAALDRMVT